VDFNLEWQTAVRAWACATWNLLMAAVPATTPSEVSPLHLQWTADRVCVRLCSGTSVRR
jgi:hypothetical protein